MTIDINDVTYYYAENVFFPNKSHLGDSNAYDLNIGELSWILPINYPTDICQTIKRCLLKLLLDISTNFDLKMHLIILGFHETKPSSIRPWEKLFAKRYPIKYFLKHQLDTCYTDGWHMFFNECQFYEKETNSYYLQWWQTTLTQNSLDQPVYLLYRKKFNYTIDNTIVFVSKMNDEDISKNIFDDLIYKTAFPVELPNKNRQDITGNFRESYRFLCNNKSFLLGIGEMMYSPSIAVSLTGDSDLLKEIYTSCVEDEKVIYCPTSMMQNDCECDCQ
jgi:hypothetical protein